MKTLIENAATLKKEKENIINNFGGGEILNENEFKSLEKILNEKIGINKFKTFGYVIFKIIILCSFMWIILSFSILKIQIPALQFSIIVGSTMATIFLVLKINTELRSLKEISETKMFSDVALWTLVKFFPKKLTNEDKISTNKAN